jgi:hypothetical protein
MKLSHPAGCWLTVPESKLSLKKLPPVVDEELLLLEELELLDDELELLELDDEDELLELLDDEELDELEELLLEELELLDEELELEELEELLLEPPLPTQDGAIKLPSWLPCTPKAFAAVWPGAGNCQLQQLVNWKLVPGLVPVRVAFH